MSEEGRDPDPGANSGSGSDPADDNVIEVDVDESASSLSPREIDRVFSLMERAVVDDSLQGTQLERLLGVLEQAVTGSSETNPETVAEMVSLLEESIVEPEDLEDVDVDGVLSVVENAIVGTTGADEESLSEAFDVLEEAVQDPTALDPQDVERFRSGLESALLGVANPARDGIDALVPLFGDSSLGPDEVEAADDDLDMFRIARVAAAMTQRATGYSMESGIRTGTRMAYAVVNSESPAELVTEARAITLDELQRSGVDIGDRRTDWLEEHDEDLVSERPLTRESLLERGEQLLSQSAEVGREEAFHPAFPSVLEDLAPDEARVLRLLATEGTQAVLDVRDKEFVPLQSTLVAENLTTVGSDAGCRHADRTPAYLQNLARLGLVRFSDEPVGDLKRYQVLEAQPHVEAAREAARRPKSVYRSVHLTEFGVEFCETCLPFDVAVERPQRRFRSDD